MQIPVQKTAIDKIVYAARLNSSLLPEAIVSYSYEILFSPLAASNLFLRYVVHNLDTEKEQYKFLCFDDKGNELDCNPIFAAQKDENEFYESLILVEKYAKL